MLKSYEAIYNQGQLHWVNHAPKKHTELRVLVIVEETEPTPSNTSKNCPNSADEMLISEYKDKLTEEQIALFSKLMGAYSLTDSATTNPYDYPKA
jgi:hypothetical protein